MEKYLSMKNGASFLLKTAEDSDAAALAAHLKQAGGESNFLSFGAEDCPYTEQSTLEMIRKAQSGRLGLVLLAYADEVLAGELFLFAGSRKRFQHVGELGISVLKDYWACGIGTALMTEALRIADEDIGFDSIRLETDADNRIAQHLYRNFGFADCGRYERASFYDGGYHAVLTMNRYRRSTEETQ